MLLKPPLQLQSFLYKSWPLAPRLTLLDKNANLQLVQDKEKLLYSSMVKVTSRLRASRLNANVKLKKNASVKMLSSKINIGPLKETMELIANVILLAQKTCWTLEAMTAAVKSLRKALRDQKK